MKQAITGNSIVNINAVASAVWDALIRPELIKQYFFGTEAISDWNEGSPIIFKGAWGDKLYEDKGTILIVEPEKLLRFSYWSSLSGIEDKPENYQIITYELFDEGGDSTLSITQENIPDENTKMHSEKIWRKVLNDLKGLLERDES
ncbi:MAG: SRPBCC domain-containing protein [Ferruginibacter sp.]